MRTLIEYFCVLIKVKILTVAQNALDELLSLSIDSI